MNRELAMFPLGMVVFPHQTVGLCVFEPRYHRLLADVESERALAPVSLSGARTSVGDDERTFVGTAARGPRHASADQRSDPRRGRGR